MQSNVVSARAAVVLPTLHPLESWGDYSPQEGVVGLMQPAMGPVLIEGKPVEARSTGDVFLGLGRSALKLEEGKGPLHWPTFRDFLTEEWQKMARAQGADPFPAFWEAALRRGGVWWNPPPTPVGIRPEAGRISAAPARLEGTGSYALLVYPSGRFYDGRSADRSWLQETPDPVTQVAWDAWVDVPAETASQMGIRRGDLLTLTSPHGSIELPAYPTELIHPGAVAGRAGDCAVAVSVAASNVVTMHKTRGAGPTRLRMMASPASTMVA